MPVQIGAKAHSFLDPTGLLSDCHRRIEMFLGSLQSVAEIIDCPLSAETRAALESFSATFENRLQSIPLTKKNLFSPV